MIFTVVTLNGFGAQRKTVIVRQNEMRKPNALSVSVDV